MSPPSVYSSITLRPSCPPAPSRYSADGVVQRRHPGRLLLANALDEPREFVLAEPRGTHLGVEIDDRHVDRIGQGVQELDRRGAREPEVVAHALADVEQDAEMDGSAVRGVASPAAKYVIVCFRPSSYTSKSLGLQPGDEPALAVRHRDAQVHQVDAGSKHGHLLDARRPGDDRESADSQHVPEDSQRMCVATSWSSCSPHDSPIFARHNGWSARGV